MSKTDIDNLIAQIERDKKEYDNLITIKKNLDTIVDTNSTISQTNQQLSDINSSSLRRQRAELDTKKRIIDYTEQDINKNYSILSTQFIIFIVISSMVLFMIAYAIFVDSNVLQGMKDAITSRFSGTTSTATTS
jgi:hypothetical protein